MLAICWASQSRSGKLYPLAPTKPTILPDRTSRMRSPLLEGGYSSEVNWIAGVFILLMKQLAG
ncbi:MAG: hypothetical protein AB4352_25600 [Hormoscilla sp.]